MSDSSPFSGVPVDIQTAIISANMNSTLLFMLGMGIYTSVYVGTIYLYMTRKADQRRGIVGVLTLLYLVVVGQLCIQWRAAKIEFIDNGDTRLSVFTATFLSSPSEGMAIFMLQYISYLLADGLLIWRCFHMYNRSLRQISIPVLLYCAEILLAIASMGYQGWIIFDDTPGPPEDDLHSQILDGSFSVVVAVTSISATSLICMRIILATKEEARSRARYKHVLYMLIESSLLYTLSIVVYAISAFTTLLPGARNLVISTELDNYATALSLIITGLAPTLMVAGVSLSPSNAMTEESATHISGLQFHHRSTTDQQDQLDISSDKISSQVEMKEENV